MGKISPVCINVDTKKNKSGLSKNKVKHIESELFERSLYDSFNFLNLELINKLANLILSFRYINIECLNSESQDVNNFISRLLKLKLHINNYHHDTKDDVLSFHIDLKNEINCDMRIYFFEADARVLISNNTKDIKGLKLVWVRSKKSYNISIEQKLKILLNCIYMNVLAQKVLK